MLRLGFAVLAWTIVGGPYLYPHPYKVDPHLPPLLWLTGATVPLALWRLRGSGKRLVMAGAVLGALFPFACAVFHAWGMAIASSNVQRPAPSLAASCAGLLLGALAGELRRLDLARNSSRASFLWISLLLWATAQRVIVILLAAWYWWGRLRSLAPHWEFWGLVLERIGRFDHVAWILLPPVAGVSDWIWKSRRPAAAAGVSVLLLPVAALVSYVALARAVAMSNFVFFLSFTVWTVLPGSVAWALFVCFLLARVREGHRTHAAGDPSRLALAASVALAIGTSVSVGLQSSTRLAAWATDQTLRAPVLPGPYARVAWDHRLPGLPRHVASYPPAPAIGVDGTVYAGHDEGISAFGADGSTRWMFATRPIRSSLAVGTDGTIYGCGIDGVLHALRPDGGPRWEHPLVSSGGAWCSGPAVDSRGRVHVVSAVSNQAVLHVLSDGGDELFSFLVPTRGSIPKDLIDQPFDDAAPVLATDGSIDFVVDSSLHSVDPTGRELWHVVVDNLRGPPSLASDGTILATAGKDLVAFGPDGSTAWRHRFGAEIRAPPTVSADGTIHVVTADHVTGLTAAGEIAWALDAQATGMAKLAGPATLDAEGGFLLSGGDAYHAFLWLGTADRRRKWTYLRQGSEWFAPSMAPDGSLRVVSLESEGAGDERGLVQRVISLQPVLGAVPMAQAGWPAPRHDARNSRSLR